jgi:hypothetical protein
MIEMDERAADYIVSLWGKNRRQFARQYWLHLSRDMPEPPLADCFGSDWIVAKLKRIKRQYDFYARSPDEEM